MAAGAVLPRRIDRAVACADHRGGRAVDPQEGCVMATPRPRGRHRRRLDAASVGIGPLGIVLIVIAQVIDGVPLGSLLQWPAALIVLGGTLASVMISYTPQELMGAVRAA